LRRFYGIISFSRYPLVELIFYENEDGICFLWDLRLWILTIQPSHSYTLAYCRPIHLISIEFQNIDNNQESLPKNSFYSPSIVIILQSVRSIWLRYFLRSIGIIRYKILQSEVEKHHFIFIIGPHVNGTYFRPNIQQNSPEILGVKAHTPKCLVRSIWMENPAPILNSFTFVHV
jgi:hypothetical protein